MEKTGKEKNVLLLFQYFFADRGSVRFVRAAFLIF
jgi:hypothetical protein